MGERIHARRTTISMIAAIGRELTVNCVTYVNLKTFGLVASVRRYYFFSLNLVASDLRNRFRRTMLGASWAVIQPLFFTLILSTVFSVVNGSSWVEYSVYVFSGLVIWDLFASSINLGSSAISSAAHYLRQYNVPVYVFSVRVVILTVVTNTFSTIGLLIWILLFDLQAVSWTTLLYPLFMVGLAVFITPAAIIASYLGLRFRDFENVIGLLVTALWFWSPVFMARDVFNHPSLQAVSVYNPARAFLDVGRGLLLENSLPKAVDLLVLGGWFVIMVPLAALCIKALRKNLYYYL